MALNLTIADFFSRGLAMGAIAPGGDLLEIGESVVVTYNTPDQLIEAVAAQIPPDRLAEAKRRVTASKANKSVYQQFFGPARAFYDAVFAPSFYMAIELGLSPRRLCIDLNGPVSLGRRFDTVINNGSSEHIFDQAKVFRFIHEATRPGGIMIHWTPSLGWENHGLYNVQPGFFFDLASANGYEVKLVGLADRDVFFPIAEGEAYRQALQAHRTLRHSMVCAILRKVTDEPFEPPIQGSYQGGVAAAYALSKVARSYVTDGRPNLALRKPAMQSSTSKWSYDGDPARDAAGGNDGVITGYYSFHTEIEMEPWWMVDLGTEVPVRDVVVYNRLDSVGQAAARAARLRIHFSPDGQSWSNVYARTEDRAFGGADGRPLRVPLGGQTARFVRLDVPGRTSLHLDEIEIF